MNLIFYVLAWYQDTSLLRFEPEITIKNQDSTKVPVISGIFVSVDLNKTTISLL